MIDGDGEFYGYLKLTHALRQCAGLVINKKKVYRLCKQMRILRPQRKIEPRAPRKLARNRLVTGSNQTWATDIKYGYVDGEDRFFYVASILDIHDRGVVGVHIGLKCEAKDIARTLKTALDSRNLRSIDLILRSDNGPQFKSKLMAKECMGMGVKQEFIPFKTPNMNAHIESFHSILEAECMAVNRFETFAEACHAILEFIKFYNERRLHSGCRYKSPRTYYLENLSKTDVAYAIAI